MSKLSVLMTVYNESQFVEYAIKACLPHVDHLVIVEGAYQETISLGASPRSTDGTIEKIDRLMLDYILPPDTEGPIVSSIDFIQANEKTDKDQRNIGLQKIKELNPDGWCLIIDGDEIYEPDTFKMVRISMSNMEKTNKYAAYFKSLTFVNDMNHYTEQEFPRLFKITPEAKFVNDNFMSWDKIGWAPPWVIKIPYITYFHYSFCKGNARFELKKKWWETRFGREFDYGWKVNDQGKIEDEGHDIYEFTAQHPKIMEDHPLKESKKKDV